MGSRPEVEGDGEGDGEDEGFSDLEGLESLDDEDEGMRNAETEGGGDVLSDAGIDVDMDDEFPDFNDEEDEEALLGSEDDVPSDLGEVFEKEAMGFKKRSSKGDVDSAALADVGESKRAKRRRQLKNLPVFAGVEEFERLLGGDEEEGVA